MWTVLVRLAAGLLKKTTTQFSCKKRDRVVQKVPVRNVFELNRCHKRASWTRLFVSGLKLGDPVRQLAIFTILILLIAQWDIAFY